MKLIFVYNAKSGKLNKYIDIGHKLISPKTYQCSLCALTHDTFSENEVWKAFRLNTDIVMEFHHIDEFEQLHPNTSYNYPVILKEEDNKLSKVLDVNALKQISSLEDLIAKVSIFSLKKVS